MTSWWPRSRPCRCAARSIRRRSPGSRAAACSPPTTSPRSSATSVAFQAVAAQIINPVLLAHRTLGIGLFPLIADVRWRPDDWVVRYGLAELRRGDPMPTGAVLDRFRQQITGYLAEAIGDVVRLPGRLLVGNER